MDSLGSRVRRVMVAGAAMAVVYGLAPAVGASVEGSWAARVASAVGAERAEAQWGVSRRVARRTARRVSRRYDYTYAYPRAAVAVSVGSESCYYADNVNYCPRMVEGRVVYVVVNDDENDDDLSAASASPAGPATRRGGADAAPAARPQRPATSRSGRRRDAP